jgi:hypothetical protein
MGVNGLGELLDAATADVPQRFRSAPLAGIGRRVRRRRAMVAAAASAVVVAVLLGGFAVVRSGAGRSPDHPVAPVVPSAAPTSPDLPALPWSSAMISRDDRTITVYAGAAGCRVLYQSRSELTGQDAGRVTIGVYARVVDAGDCATAGQAVPMVVHLAADLGTRAVLDAAGGSHPVYHERDLPDLPASSWHSVTTTWQATDVGWYQAFNGPNGTGISLMAWPTDQPVDLGPVVSTTSLGTRHGTITGGGAGLWRVSWRVGQDTYSLRYEPADARAGSLSQFKQLLRTLNWS